MFPTSGRGFCTSALAFALAAGSLFAAAPAAAKDNVAPNTRITSSPARVTHIRSASIVFRATERRSKFRCKLDGARWKRCSSPHRIKGLSLGRHVFRVRAVDRAGNVDRRPARAIWRITTPVSSLPGSAPVSLPAIVPAADVPRPVPPLPDPPDLPDLPPVVTPDPEPTPDPTPVPDTTPPQTSISSNPAASTTSTSASFAFSSSESPSTFACRLDGAGFSACTSPQSYSGLAVGSHTFRVAAKDAAGNTDAAPATYTWTITAPPPPPPPPPPPSGTADFYVASNGSDSNACSLSAPCRTLQKGFDVASAGDVVEVGGGSYPAQRVAGNKGSEDDVVLRATPGAQVNLGTRDADGDCSVGLRIWASHVTFEGFSGLGEVCVVGAAEGGGAQTDVTLLDNHGSSLLIDSATRVSVYGGDYGGSGGTYTNHNSGIRANGSAIPSDILFDGVTMHDQACTEVYCHIECLIVGAAQRLTIRNSTFYHCPIMGVYLEAFNGPISDVLIENNFFADSTEPDGGPGSERNSVWFNDGDTYTNVLVRFNSMKGALHFEGGSNMVNARAIGNLGPRNDTPCSSNVTWSYNVWADQSCGGSTNAVTHSSPPWVNPSGDGNLDYHLTGGVAQDYVPDLGADYQLATDIDGQARPAGARRDAGADERG